MATQNSKNGNSVMVRICAFIVDKRNLFFLIYALLCIFSVIARGWVGVENDLAYYLPSDSETRQGLDIMEEQFVTYGSVKVMVANISYEQALFIKQDIESMEGVFSCDVDDTSDHYNNGSALFTITFNYDEKEEICLTLLDQVKNYFADYDCYISTTLGDIQAELIDKEMNVISVLVVIIVVLVLVLTSQAYAEVPVLLLTFGSAAIVQMGTNFLFGTISFVSNSVTIVLQLALSVDYAVILLNRYKEEREKLEAREACILALSKAIPEISGSSLTTMGGLIAMLFMQFGIGKDMGMVLIKAIILSLLSVFLLMPGIIMLFATLMDNTKHKNFVPQIPFVGKFAYLSRYIIAPLFVVVIIVAQRISSGTPYVYGYSRITPPLINDVQVAANMQKETFTADNMMALVFPSGDYDKEKLLISELENHHNVTQVTGLANTEALGGYTLTDKLTPRQFSELLDLDYEVAELVYAGYAVNDSDYAKVVNGLVNYRVPLIDMFMYVYQEVSEGYVTLDEELMKKLNDADRMMNFGKKQLQGEDYSRILVYTSLPEESDETFDFIKELHKITEKYYDEDKIFVVGESVSQYDLKKCFSRDNTVTSVISILAVLVVLLFTFKSAGMPVLLITVIQGCIWINFSFPAIMHDNLFFLGYLIVSSIQMGANIDYAIVIAGRYTELRETRGKREAIIDTMNLSFPTIITSGTMLAVAGILIGNMTSDCAIYGIGKCLGRGTIISIFVTMFVLPQILLVGDKIIELTAFVMNKPVQTKQLSGLMRIDGFVRGKIDGNVNGVVHAIVRGNISAYIDNEDVKLLSENADDPSDTSIAEQEGV
ncbi:MAG: MMPL family transporter [Butyrivibrio sp.]|nr:MMPL family transporter [Butyrivibrio sp.]